MQKYVSDKVPLNGCCCTLNLTLPYLTLPYFTLPYLTLPYLTLPYLWGGSTAPNAQDVVR